MGEGFNMMMRQFYYITTKVESFRKDASLGLALLNPSSFKLHTSFVAQRHQGVDF
jgi:hypothetical protein